MLCHKTSIWLTDFSSLFSTAAVITKYAGGSDGKESAINAGDLGPIPWSGRSPGEGNDYTLQYSCMESSMDKGAWQLTIHGVTESEMTEWLTHAFTLNSSITVPKIKKNTVSTLKKKKIKDNRRANFGIQISLELCFVFF